MQAMTNLKTRLKRLLQNTSGNFATILAVAAVPIFGVIALAVDVSQAVRAKSSLQELTDGSALAAVQVRKKNGGEWLTDNAGMKKAATDFVISQTEYENVAVDTQLDATTGVLMVSATYAMPTSIAGQFGIVEMPIRVYSKVGTSEPTASYCMLALSTTKAPAITFDGTSDFAAPNCYVHSNGLSNPSMLQKGNATAIAAHFCAASTVRGKYSSTPEENCDVLPDPFAGLKIPPINGNCDYKNATYTKGNFTLSPGRYCGGLSLKTHAKVKLQPGTYIIDSGMFSVGSQSEVTGNGVVFVFVGSNTTLEIRANSMIDISAPTSGTYEGMIFVQNPASSPQLTAVVNGGGSLKIVGTWYFPTQIVNLTGGGTIGLQSAQTAMVADSFVFTGNGATTLDVDFNSDYSAAGYGVPGELGIGERPYIIE